MPEVKVSQFADVVGISVDRLLEQLNEAGIASKQADDMITDAEKTQLLGYLRQKHGKQQADLEPSKVTLRRKTVSEIKVPVAGDRSSRSKTPRSKTVNVEFRKRRTYVKRSVIDEENREKAEREAAERAEAEARTRAEQSAAEAEQAPVAETATEAAEQAEVRAAEDKAAAELEAQLEGASEQPVAEEAAPAAEAPAETEQEPAAEQPAETGEPATDRKVATPTKADKEKAEKAKEKRNKGRDDRSDDRRKGKGREELHVASDKAGRRRKKPQPRARGGGERGSTSHQFAKPTAPVVREVNIPESITVADLAQRMSVKASEVIKIMMNLGTMATINQTIDQETAALIVEEMGHTAKLLKENALEEEVLQVAQQGEKVSRAPVVTIMGHVDHGKTSLLDYIRRTKVAAGEAGGITQHIGAYQVQHETGPVTFLDTPGHEAFTAMRARGAQVTDIIILVVAADDGVMPQTEEAIKHAKASGVPIIVAVNKIDKDNADPDRVKQELSQHEVISEDWGGDTQFVPVSALKGTGIDNLIDAVLLQAELLELKAVAEGPATGAVVESRLDKGRGPVATILVQSGTLNKGDVVVSGHEYGRVRAMLNERGEDVESVGPSTPVEVLGLSGTPRAGDELVVVGDEKKAREIAMFRQGKYREVKLAKQQANKLEDMMAQMGEGEVVTLNVLIKADVQGSAEALADSLEKLSNDEVKVSVVSNGVGGINESDVNLALASGAMIIGFNVRADAAARKLVEDEGLDLRYYSVIYDVIDDIKTALSGMLAPEVREQIIGNAEVKQVFRSKKFGDIAGCIVTEGVVKRSNPIRVLRDNVVVFEGQLESLRRVKDDVNEVQAGTECGIGVKDYEVREGDQIEVFERVTVNRSL
ncbi:translation initiation factor IF-2 [Methylohalomonas lacus]|uniref:Translation initiation factor IF-2 n=1 Tax=Methylohalomonas lacus TaxID=398773 RepID=A0AAE3L1S1_9GAMM|nr:translation initiation factor IF-2 [Methylohalomonas lacus]MCS3903491.1 translation initiation factor IF-2 [Methylohalomonas lacus]